MPDKTEEKQKPQLYKKGQSGNPKGRPKGARNKLNEAFIKALAEDFAIHGIESIEAVREKDPSAYLRTITAILPKEINGNVKHDHKHEHTHESVSDTVEWINGMLGTTKNSENKKPSAH